MNMFNKSFKFYIKVCALLVIELFLVTNVNLGYAFTKGSSALSRIKDPSKFLHDRNVYKQEKKKKDMLSLKERQADANIHLPSNYLQEHMARSAQIYAYESFQSFQDLMAYVEALQDTTSRAQGFAGRTETPYEDGKIVVSQYGKVQSITNETMQDEKGNSYKRNIDFVYADNKRQDTDMIEYHEMKRNFYPELAGQDSYGDWTYTDWQAEYDNASNLTSYYKLETDNFGNKKTTNWSDGVYDNKGNLLGFSEQIVDSFGNTTTRSWNSDKTKYDSKNNVLSYEEKYVDEYGKETITSWYNGKYNGANELNSYNKVVLDTTTGQVTKYNWKGTYHTDLTGDSTSKRLFFYEETKTDSTGGVTKTVWHVGDDNFKLESSNNLSYYVGDNTKEYTKFIYEADGTVSKEYWYAGEYVRSNVKYYKSNKINFDQLGKKIYEEDVEFDATYDVKNNLQDYKKIITDVESPVKSV